MTDFALVSVHSGHSGNFCSHALDSLEDIVQRYVDLNFEWVCLTEHMPAHQTHLIPPEELAAGFSVDSMQTRFDDYFVEARRLQAHFEDQIKIFVGFETDAYSGYQDAVAELISRHEPDMIVGSVHHLSLIHI